MTRQEAAEIILRGEPFLCCPQCLGTGFDGGISCLYCLPESDTKCGSGKALNSEYAEACRLLNIEPPKTAKWVPSPISQKLEDEDD